MKTTNKFISAMLLTFFIVLSTYSQQVPFQQWANVYNSPTNLSDAPSAMSVDSGGNMYITGTSDSLVNLTSFRKPVTMKYNAAGNLQWSKNYINPEGINEYDKGNAVASDNSGNCYVLATVKYGGAVYWIRSLLIKYNSAGDTVWTKSIADTSDLGSSLGSGDVKTDNSGNIYVTCVLASLAHTTYITVAKLTPGGQITWQYSYTGPNGNHGNTAKKLILDGTGNVYVIGTTSVLGFGGFYWSDCVTFKLNNSGVQQWAATYDGAYHGGDAPVDIALDASNNVYITGYDCPAINQRGIIIIKYDGNTGGQQWVKNPVGTYTALPYNTGNGLTVSQAGDVYACGLMQNLDGKNAFLMRLNSSGVEQWRKFYYNEPNGGEFRAVSLDNAGNIIVMGNAFYSGISFSMTAKYNATGDLIWNKEYNPGTYINASLLQVLPDNSIYTCGYAGSLTSDIFSLKYIQVSPQTFSICKSTNKPIHDFQNTYDTINISGIPPTAQIVDVQFKVDTILHTYIHDLIGTLKGPTGLTDTLFKNPGKPQTGLNIIGCNITDSATHLLDTSAAAPLTGYYKPYRSLSSFSGNNPDGNWIFNVYDYAGGDTGIVKKYCITIIYFDPAIIGIQTISNQTPKGFLLSQNYPNPFNPTTNIKFSLPKSGNVTLKIYDLLGREVATLVNEYRQAGTFNVNFDGSNLASGVYFYRIKTEDFTDVKKMVLVK